MSYKDYSDFENLILAAKAANIKHVNYSGVDYDGSYGVELVDSVGRHIGSWNPIKDDADAFRLAVKLNIFDDPMFSHIRSVLMFTENIEKYEANRRAIVYVASEMAQKSQYQQ